MRDVKKNSIKYGVSLVLMLALGLCACSGQDIQTDGDEVVEKETVVLEVVTTFAGNDGGASYYREACQTWAEETGNTLVDMSAISDETFKNRVITDFETGSEPDVLFFFNGADANGFIKAGKVVSLDEIKESYPNFGSNLDVEKIPVSLVDGKVYAIPVNGYWEAMYVNNTVLEAAGVKMPDENYTWEQFLSDCAKIKEAGYTPIAASLGNIPHYWWEFAIFNQTGPVNHMRIPMTADGLMGKAWVDGMEDIKHLYELGFFPANTNHATDEQTFSMFMEGKAAFLIDGSWKLGSIVQGCQKYIGQPDSLDEEKLEQFSVTFVPGTENRKATDLIGGMSMGYYITRDAWEDPETREAAVSFVSYMTSNEVAPRFAQHTTNVLKDATGGDATEYNSLQLKAIEMMNKSTSFTGAVQDLFQGECRTPTFEGMSDIVTGKVTAYDAVAEGLEIYNNK